MYEPNIMPTGRRDVNLHAILSSQTGNAIMTKQDSWGAHSDEPVWKPITQVDMLRDSVSHNLERQNAAARAPNSMSRSSGRGM